jgi:hypothetical protein
LDFFDVRRADAADGDLDEQFVRADARDRHGLDAQIVHAAINDGAHGFGNLGHAEILTTNGHGWTRNFFNGGSKKLLSENSGQVSAVLMQLFLQVLDGDFAIYYFAAPDLLQTAGDFLAQFGCIRADEFLLRAQHSEALGNHVAGGTVMTVLQLLGDELFLLGCEGDRHG